MIRRKIEDRIRRFLQESRKALLITGPALVGKTHVIRSVGKSMFPSFVEVSFRGQPDAARQLYGIRDAGELLRRISNLTGQPILSGKTLIFLDDVHACRDILTAVRLLVEEGSCRYVLSGSNLSATLFALGAKIDSYLDVWKMYPLDFQEFAAAAGIPDMILKHLRQAYENETPVDAFIHSRMMEMLRQYLLVGGMPAAVSQFLQTNNLACVAAEQQGILTRYRQEIAVEDPSGKHLMLSLFQHIPDALDAKGKRFYLRDVQRDLHFSQCAGGLRWLRNAGLALSVYCVSELELPLQQHWITNRFKLFLPDVGLLAAFYGLEVPIQVLTKQETCRIAALYENFGLFMLCRGWSTHSF